MMEHAICAADSRLCRRPIQLLRLAHPAPRTSYTQHGSAPLVAEEHAVLVMAAEAAVGARVAEAAGDAPVVAEGAGGARVVEGALGEVGGAAKLAVEPVAVGRREVAAGALVSAVVRCRTIMRIPSTSRD